LQLAPGADVQLVMPRLGEPVEPAHADTVTPWWRGVEGRTIARDGDDTTMPPEVAWPFD
jgi:hypothetical protein